MSAEIRSYTISVPAGTPIAAPVEVDCTFPPRAVDRVEIIVPPGPNGVLGFYIANSGVQVIPYDSDDWIISNDEKIVWDLDSQITSGSWQVFAYNTGVNNHTFYVRFLLSLIPDSTNTTDVSQPLDLSSLGSGSLTDPTADTNTEGGVFTTLN